MKKHIIIITAMLLLLPIVAGAQITSNPTTNAEVAKEWTYQVEVDTNENITYALEEKPSNMDINNTGFMSWTPSQEGQYDVNISIYNESNNVLLTNQEFTIAVTAISSQFNLDNVELGSDDLERGFRETETVNIENTGSFEITNVEVEDTIGSKYNTAISTAGTTIDPHSELTMTISYDVPEDENSERKRIGSITLTGESEGNDLSLTRNVYLTTKNNLVIDEIEVRVDGRRDRMTSDGVIDRQAQMDSSIELTLRLLNDGDIDMEDVDAEIYAPDIPDADGLDDFIRRIRPGRTESISFDFELDPRDINPEDEPFEIEVLVTGIDENNARHGEVWFLELELDVDRRDVRIVESRVRPEVVTCLNPRLTVETEIRNVGQRDLDQAMMRARVLDLDITQLRRDIEIDRSERRTINLGIDIPEDTTPGEYFIDLYAHPTRSTTDYTDTEVLSFVVEQCPTDEEEVEEEEEIEEEEIPPVVIGEPVERTEDRGLFDGDAYLVVLSGLVVMLAAIVVIMFIQLTRK